MLLVLFWLFQIADVMKRRDDEFVGRFDKILWFALVFFGLFIGAFVYYVSKPRTGARVKP